MYEERWEDKHCRSHSGWKIPSRDTMNCLYPMMPNGEPQFLLGHNTVGRDRSAHFRGMEANRCSSAGGTCLTRRRKADALRCRSWTQTLGVEAALSPGNACDTVKDTEHIGRAGDVRQFSARTTVSFLLLALYWGSLLQAQRTKGIMVAGVAGLVAGAMSMAAGEYVSVSSQADTERADLARESKELAANPEQEHAELMSIYVKRGLDETLASSVATQ